MIHGFDQKDVFFRQVLLESGYWPARGIVYSLMVHTMMLSVMLAISISGILAPPVASHQSHDSAERLDLREVVYLPVLGGNGAPSPGELEASDERGVASSGASEGLSYPGPQPILSDFPDPTNSSQTVLRPALDDPEIIDSAVPLPNMIQLADRGAVVQAEAPQREILIAPVVEVAESEPVAPESSVLEQRQLDPLLAEDLSALAEVIETLQPLPVDDVAVGLPERPLDPARAEDLSALRPTPSPLQPLPARRIDLALPTRALDPVETTDLSDLAPDRSPLQPLPASRVDLGLPSLTLTPEPAVPSDLGALAEERDRPQPLPSRQVEPGLPTRSLASTQTASPELGGLRSERERAESLPVRSPAPGLPNMGLEGAGGGHDQEDLLALSPMPGADRVRPPRGEARGLFAISTTPNLVTASVLPGIASDTGSDGARDPERGLTSPDFLPGLDPSSDPAPTGITGGDETGSSGSTGEEGSQSGGAGGGQNVFPGITILAGGPTSSGDVVTGVSRSAENGVGASRREPDASDESPDADRNNTPGNLQRSYGVTVLSTESSGGGLPRFGVFTDEQVHTVFFDMRRNEDDLTPAWTVEYGVPQGSRVQTSLSQTEDAEGTGVGFARGFLLPFPINRTQPLFPDSLVARYEEQLVIAYAVIGVDGKLGQTAVKQSPDERLIQPVLAALAEWTFRPARLDGEPVPVKILLGIPLSFVR